MSSALGSAAAIAVEATTIAVESESSRERLEITVVLLRVSVSDDAVTDVT
jgi:hypothetical protein